MNTSRKVIIYGVISASTEAIVCDNFNFNAYVIVIILSMNFSGRRALSLLCYNMNFNSSGLASLNSIKLNLFVKASDNVFLPP